MLQILHNPRCGKSRNCLAFLTESNQKYKIIKYLEDTLNVNDIKSLLNKLNLKPIEIVRQKEQIWIENFKEKNLSDSEIIDALVNNPILIERPIVIKGGKAIIGRDIEKLDAFI